MATNKPLTTRRFLFIWLLQAPAFALFVSCILLWFGPKEAVTQAVCYLVPDRTNPPFSIQVEAYCKGRGDWRKAYVRFMGGVSDAYAEIDLKTMRVLTASPANFGNSLSTPPPNYASPHALTDAEALLWYGYAGEDVNDPKVIAEANELSTILGTIHRHGLANLTPTHFDYVDRGQPIFLPAGWFVRTLITFWMAVWLLGLGWFFLVKRRHAINADRKSTPDLD